jgi:hypothetical protein
MALFSAHARSQRLDQLQKVVLAERTDQSLDRAHAIVVISGCNVVEALAL